MHGSLLFVVDYKEKVAFSHSLLLLNKRPPREWIDATRPVMILIETQLEEICGLTNLVSSVVER